MRSRASTHSSARHRMRSRTIHDHRERPYCSSFTAGILSKPFSMTCFVKRSPKGRSCFDAVCASTLYAAATVSLANHRSCQGGKICALRS
ncbi:hypothetical protein C8R45DRAFT_902722 [Mycena sanguinolenta]|nr:hypothetical protein C8R45DRAFT_902722 [Mycena sanguinolenta]